MSGAEERPCPLSGGFTFHAYPQRVEPPPTASSSSPVPQAPRPATRSGVDSRAGGSNGTATKSQSVRWGELGLCSNHTWRPAHADAECVRGEGLELRFPSNAPATCNPLRPEPSRTYEYEHEHEHEYRT